MSEDHKKNFVLALILIALVAILALTGCANISVTPPAPRPDAVQSRIVPGEYAHIWARAIGWFDAHEVEITDIDERGGLIHGRLSVAEGAGVIDCGTFQVTRALSPPRLSRDARVQVQMRGGLSQPLQVLVAVTGTYRIEIIDNYAAHTISHTGPCVSLGTLERDIFAFLTG